MKESSLKVNIFPEYAISIIIVFYCVLKCIIQYTL